MELWALLLSDGIVDVVAGILLISDGVNIVMGDNSDGIVAGMSLMSDGIVDIVAGISLMSDGIADIMDE